jgi:hypothetical protein
METTLNLCECGCGEEAGVYASSGHDYRKGQPKRFIYGHNATGSPVASLEVRFWSKVNKNGPTLVTKLGKCWVWTAAKTSGYGVIWLGKEAKQVRSSRVAWFLETGRWPKPYALHKCDNPACVRFSHLFEGDDRMNTDDKVKKGRCNSPIGKDNGRAKLTFAKAKNKESLKVL